MDRALAQGDDDAGVRYVTPTIRHATTATRSRRRREDIVTVCRARVIEDDVDTLRADPDRPPLAMLASERTLHAISLSKALNPALRVGGLVTPVPMHGATMAALQAAAVMVAPLSAALMEQWHGARGVSCHAGCVGAAAQALGQGTEARPRAAL